MSKKTIVFKMPTPEAAGRDDEAALAPAAPTKPDQWVQRGDAPPTSAQDVFTVDLARERQLREALVLAAALPAMLGWFWLTHTMERYRRVFAD